MQQVYGYENENGEWTVFFVMEGVPDSLKQDVIEIEVPDDGVGILRRAKDGSFYYEPFPTVEEPPIIEQPTEPEPTETLEEKISRLFTVTEQNNLITVDAVLGVYEELVALREEVATLKGTSNNA